MTKTTLNPNYVKGVKDALGFMSPSTSQILLVAGELTTSEIRSIHAVIDWKRRQIEGLLS